MTVVGSLISYRCLKRRWWEGCIVDRAPFSTLFLLLPPPTLDSLIDWLPHSNAETYVASARRLESLAKSGSVAQVGLVELLTNHVRLVVTTGLTVISLLLGVES